MMNLTNSPGNASGAGKNGSAQKKDEGPIIQGGKNMHSKRVSVGQNQPG